MSVIDGENAITECSCYSGYVQTEFHCTCKPKGKHETENWERQSETGKKKERNAHLWGMYYKKRKPTHLPAEHFIRGGVLGVHPYPRRQVSEIIALYKALPALQVAIDDDCLGKGLAFTKNILSYFDYLFFSDLRTLFHICTETEVRAHTQSQTNPHLHLCPGFGKDRMFEVRILCHTLSSR